MNVQKNSEPLTSEMVILTSDQVRELHAIAMSLESLVGLLTGFAKTIRQIAGEEPEPPELGL